MNVIIKTHFGEGVYDSVSKALAQNKVVQITKARGGQFCVEEMCDEHYSVILTRHQLLEWSEELRRMAEGKL